MIFGDRFRTVAPLLALALAGFVVAYQFVDPAPPKRLVLSAGQPGGSYAALAASFRDLLQAEGVEVEILESAGSQQNRQRLIEGGGDVAFVQSGIATPADGLLSLGSLYYEPLWLFSRSDHRLTRLNEAKGMRIAIGPEGSGTRELAMQLLAENGIDAENSTLSPLAGAAAADALLAGRLDLLFMVSGAGHAAVARLLASDAVSLMPMARAEAYVRRHPALSRLVLPRVYSIPHTICRRTTCRCWPPLRHCWSASRCTRPCRDCCCRRRVA